MYLLKSLLIVFALTALGFCDTKESSLNSCGDNVACVEEKLKEALDEVDKQRNVKVLGDFLILESTGQYTRTARSDDSVTDKILRFLGDKKMKVKIPTSQNDLDKIYEGARSSKLKKIVLPLLVLLKLKSAIILPAVLSAIALVAFKGLGISLMAMLISGAIGFKSLLESHSSSKFTYEVVPSHWSRSGIESYPIPGYHTIPQ